METTRAVRTLTRDMTAVNEPRIPETWFTTGWVLEHGIVDLRPPISAELPLERADGVDPVVLRSGAAA